MTGFMEDLIILKSEATKMGNYICMLICNVILWNGVSSVITEVYEINSV